MSQADTASASPPERPGWGPFLRRALLVLGLTVGIPLLFLLYHRWHAGREARAAAAAVAAADPGWTWEEIQARRPGLPAGKNGADHVLAAYQMLPRRWPGWNDPTLKPPHALSEDDRDALDNALTPAVPWRRLSDRYLAAVRAEVQRSAPALAEALKVLDTPQGRFPIEWRTNYFDSRFEQVQQSRAIAALFGYAALVRAHDGDFRGAFLCVRAGLGMARTLDDEPSIIVYLVRLAHVNMAVQSLENTLALGRPDAEEFPPLTGLLEAEDAAAPGLLLASLRGERAGVDKPFQAYEAGTVPLADLMRMVEMDPGGWAGAVGPFATTAVRQAHAAYLRHMTAFIEISRLPVAEQSERFRAAAQALKEDPKAVFARRILPSVERVMAARLRCQARLRCALIGLAAERYRQETGRWPDTLAALLPRYLAQVPADPYDGQPLRCKRITDGVVLYAVGPDLKDDGGVLHPREVGVGGTDVGFRLWDEDRRGRPASR